MATFEGTLKDFTDFIGPLTRNIVCNLARKHKKHTTCSKEGCGKRKSLEAAHIKGKSRPEIISKILLDYQTNDNFYSIDLVEFKDKFIKEHQPISAVIIPMCRQHHTEYDNEENIKEEYPIVINELEDEDNNIVYTEDELKKREINEFKTTEELLKNQSYSISEIKKQVAKEYKIKQNQLAFARISEFNNLWNFDVNKEKFDKDFGFIFYNQNKKLYEVAYVKENTLPIEKFQEKDEKAIRFFIDSDYMDRSGYMFEFSK